MAIALIAAYVLKRTRGGCTCAPSAKNPQTADAAGIDVNKYKYRHLRRQHDRRPRRSVLCHGLCLRRLVERRLRRPRLAFAIALVIFTVWKPNVGVLASFLFGGLYILHIFLPSGTNLAVKELYKMIPYVVTIIVLIITSVRSKRENQPPASLGLPYFREER